MDPNDPFVVAVRRSFFLSSLALPAALAVVGLIAPDGAAFLRMGGDILLAALFVALPGVMLLLGWRPELSVPMLHVGNIGFASVLFAHSVLFDQPYAFLLAFCWAVLGILLSLRRQIDVYINLYGLVGHFIAMGAVAYGLLSWING